jgi:hypothetical protein
LFDGWSNRDEYVVVFVHTDGSALIVCELQTKILAHHEAKPGHFDPEADEIELDLELAIEQWASCG